MLQEHARIVQFIAMAGEARGRKKLQKMIYIAKKMDFPFAEKYELHMYGPYSEELTLRVEELCEMGFLSESCTDKGSYVQYSYHVTEAGGQFLETAEAPHEKLADCIDRLKEKSSRFLGARFDLALFRPLAEGRANRESTYREEQTEFHRRRNAGRL